MMKTIFAVFLIVFSGLNLFGQSSKEELSDEEYKFWTENLVQTNSEVPRIIRNETISVKFPLYGEKKFLEQIRNYYAKAKITDVSDYLIKNFNTKNNKSYLLEKKFLWNNYLLVNKNDLSEIFGQPKNPEEKWKKFKIKYNTPFLEGLSRIGFSEDKKQALIYNEYFCGITCGSGFFNFFIKRGNEWILEAEINVWNS